VTGLIVLFGPLRMKRSPMPQAGPEFTHRNEST
jgi:hypothetical protein